MLSDALIRHLEYKELHNMMIINNAEKCMQESKFNRDCKMCVCYTSLKYQ